MSLRPIPAKWFELVTVHTELARVMECLSRTGAVELEARSRATDRLLFPGPRRRAKGASRTRAALPELLAGARGRERPPARAIGRQPEIGTRASLRMGRRSRSDHRGERAANTRGGRSRSIAQRRWRAPETPGPICICLPVPARNCRCGCWRCLWARCYAKSLHWCWFKSWLTPLASYVLVVGRAGDISDIEAQIAGLKGRVVPLPPWLPSSADNALAAIDERLARAGQAARRRCRAACGAFATAVDRVCARRYCSHRMAERARQGSAWQRAVGLGHRLDQRCRRHGFAPCA